MSARLPRVDAASPALEALAHAGFLAGVPRDEVARLAAHGEHRSYAAGERLFGELEPRESLVVILGGRVRILIAAGEPSEQTVAEVGAGAALGEVGLLTGRVATATGVAVEATEVLLLRRDAIAELMERFPSTARAFAKILAQRIRDTDAALARALSDEDAPAPQILKRAEAVTSHGFVRALRVAFRETILQRRTELPFLFLSGFVLSLIVARLAVRLGHFSAASLRDLYVLGLLLLIGTGACAHFVFHRTARRILCAAYGAALGFLANELSVLLAFDVFYLDTTTKDPNARHTYLELYDRAPTRYAVLLGLAIALQATYMRGFYRRVFFILMQRARRGFGR